MEKISHTSIEQAPAEVDPVLFWVRHTLSQYQRNGNMAPKEAARLIARLGEPVETEAA